MKMFWRRRSRVDAPPDVPDVDVPGECNARWRGVPNSRCNGPAEHEGRDHGYWLTPNLILAPWPDSLRERP